MDVGSVGLLRILVADDSAVMRGVMKTLFLTHAEDRRSELPAMELCGVARDGLECLEAVRVLQPDVLILDLEMPRMHGLDVLDQLQRECAGLPVIMCSSYTENGARSTLDALARGVSDYVMKPSEQSDFATALRMLSEQLLPKVVALGSRAGRGRKAGAESERERTKESLREGLRQTRVDAIVIGVSTGGPSALETLLPRLPFDLPVPVLIVQHMPKLFTGELAARLNRCCAMPVTEAYHGALLAPGTIWLAPGDMHMEVEGQRQGVNVDACVRVCLHQDAPVNYCRPSVDHLFHSAVKLYGAGTLALVMTGMGADGLAGARAVHQAGGVVLAQDEVTSVVWGMPGRVTQAGIASATLPLLSLADELTKRSWVGRDRARARSSRSDEIVGPQMFGHKLQVQGVTNGML